MTSYFLKAVTSNCQRTVTGKMGNGLKVLVSFKSNGSKSRSYFLKVTCPPLLQPHHLRQLCPPSPTPGFTEGIYRQPSSAAAKPNQCCSKTHLEVDDVVSAGRVSIPVKLDSLVLVAELDRLQVLLV